MKALTYGNLGTGGLSRATFEQTLPDDHPSGRFIPGFGTHVVEHRAIDPAGNYSTPESYKATVLPGALATCTTTLTGTQNNVNVTSGVTCLQGATVNNVTVGSGASVVARNSTIGGTLNSTGADTVQMFGSTVKGAAQVRNSTRDVTIAGSTFRSGAGPDRQHAGHGQRALHPSGRGVRADPVGQQRQRADVLGQQRRRQGLRRAEQDPGQLQRLRTGAGGRRDAGRRQRAGDPVADARAGSDVPNLVAGVGNTYTASTTGNVISTAGDALLSVADPSSTNTGHLVNGAFFLPQPLQARARNAANTGTAYNNVGSSASPLNLLTWNGPISNDALTLEFSQRVNANDALRTGTYSKTLTFTLSTTQP